MANSTSEMFAHRLERLMLVTPHHGSSFDGASGQAEQVEVEERFLELKRTQRYKPPVVSIDPLEDDSIFIATNSKRLVDFRHRQLIHRNNVLLAIFVLSRERTSIVWLVPCLSRTSHAVLVERGVG